jgi:hypothetical protein
MIVSEKVDKVGPNGSNTNTQNDIIFKYIISPI